MEIRIYFIAPLDFTKLFRVVKEQQSCLYLDQILGSSEFV